MMNPFEQLDLFTPDAADDLIQQLRAKYGAANVIEVRRDARYITLHITLHITLAPGEMSAQYVIPLVRAPSAQGGQTP